MAVTKQIEWVGDIDSRIEFCCGIIGVTSAVEIYIIKELFKINSGNMFPIDAETKSIACFKGDISINTFNTSLSRLMTKKAVMKLDRTYKLHPIFIDLHKTDSITIKWKQ
jgi:hypothetical protein